MKLVWLTELAFFIDLPTYVYRLNTSSTDAIHTIHTKRCTHWSPKCCVRLRRKQPDNKLHFVPKPSWPTFKRFHLNNGTAEILRFRFSHDDHRKKIIINQVYFLLSVVSILPFLHVATSLGPRQRIFKILFHIIRDFSEITDKSLSKLNLVFEYRDIWTNRRLLYNNLQQQPSVTKVFGYMVRSFKQNHLFYCIRSINYAKACKEFVSLISASSYPGNTVPLKEMSQRWQAVGSTVSDLTGWRFEPQAFHSKHKSVTAWPSAKNFVLVATRARAAQV